jgi:hypothetical protein
MRYTKLFALAAMAAGMLLSTGTAKAQDRYYDGDWNRNSDRQHLRRDYARVESLRAAVADDRHRLAEDRRCGRRWAAEQDARDLARDQRALEYQLRDIGRDRAAMYWDRR